MIEPCEEIKRVEQRYEKALDDMEKHYKAVLDKIRAEIEKPLLVERYADTESAKAQAIALSWCLEIIDKYTAESEEQTE